MLHIKKAIQESEMLVAFSEDGVPVRDSAGTLLTVCRASAHKYGIPHGTANILLVLSYRSIAADALVVLQKRSKEKAIFPGAWTVSCGGHMGETLDPVEAAIREAKEEFDLTIDPKDLIPVTQDGRPLENFLKVWKSGPRTYSQLDPRAQTVLVPGGTLHDPGRDRDVLSCLRALPPSSLGDETPLAFHLDTFNREFCYYFLYEIPAGADKNISFSDGEAEGAQQVSIADFVRDAPYMTDSSFTLVRGVPDLRAQVEALV